eukprot:TRINITY_DN105347_c0_g1_i1.p1 TRINITY_DN105347_c0_g1~~TRINITY_DN105347_c0_g1_i1.p1  ORF type:complete len:117 (+),score=9.93 TRINITY_DN105347_c0_g1_i1:1-351(+)
MTDGLCEERCDTHQQLHFDVLGPQGEGAHAVWWGPHDEMPDHIGILLRATIWRPEQSVFVFGGTLQRAQVETVAIVEAQKGEGRVSYHSSQALAAFPGSMGGAETLPVLIAVATCI